MRARTNGAAGQRLREAKGRLQRWRRGCRRPGRIPTELWRLAAEAASEHGVEETAGHLQLDAQRLEQWVQRLGLACRPAEPAAVEFVELPPLAANAWGECHVEVEEPSGRKLRIWLKGSAAAQLGAVLPALCGKEAAP
jgi:hypothetical protein